MSRSLPAPVVEFVTGQARSDLYAAYCRNRLVELLEGPPPAGGAAHAESAPCALIENEVRQLLGNRAVVERRPGSRQPGEPANGPTGEPSLVIRVGETTGEAGLRFVVDSGALGPALVPRSTADRVFGCGAAGCKAQIALVLAQLKLLAEVESRFDLAPAVPLAYYFGAGGVPQEHDGWLAERGSRGGRWEAVVLTSTGGVPHTAQPGAVPFQCVLSGPHAVGLFAFVVQAVEAEGARLRNECRQGTGSPDRWDVATQTNHGVLAGYGVDPAIACDRVAVRVRIKANANPERIAMRMTEVLDATLFEYLRHRPDLTKEVDPVLGEPKLKQHYAIAFEPAADALVYRIEVFGRAAPLGAVLEGDSAISKAAFMFGALLQIQRNFPNVQAEAAFADLSAAGGAGDLIIHGVQTFGSGYDADEVRRRLSAAAQSGAEAWRRAYGAGAGDTTVTMRFEGPERRPVEQSSGSGVSAAFAAALELASLPSPGGRVWPGISCADRVAAAGCPVVIFGPGRLERRGSAHECIDIPEIQQSLSIATLAALVYTPVSVSS